MSTPDFECDLEPETHMPRVRFNFPNGWSASLLIRTGPDFTRAMLSSVAVCPTSLWNSGNADLVGHELSAVEAVAALDMIANRPTLTGDPISIPCPTCTAKAGERCKGVLGRGRLRTHQARLYAAEVIKAELGL